MNNLTISQYKINVPREVQNAIKDNKKSLHLRIGGTSVFPAAYRLIAGGKMSVNGSARVHFRIVYSKIN